MAANFAPDVFALFVLADDAAEDGFFFVEDFDEDVEGDFEDDFEDDFDVDDEVDPGVDEEE